MMTTSTGQQLRAAAILMGGLTVAGCAAQPTPEMFAEPNVSEATPTQTALRQLPPPTARVPIAVYEFEDVTGQFKPQENVQTLSRAVTQGGAAVLIKALKDAGEGSWFTLVEREGLDDLLQERKIIREMRSRYLGEREADPSALPPLLFAGIILKGGIIGFDTNTLSGGFGARFLGIGGDVKYRQNTVTVNLRAVSVKTGEVLANVTTEKTVVSVGGSAGAFRYVSFDKLLEIETGVTANEPASLAVRRAIEKAVEALILQGADADVWSFENDAVGRILINRYRSEENGVITAEAAEAALRASPFSEDLSRSAAKPKRNSSYGSHSSGFSGEREYER